MPTTGSAGSPIDLLSATGLDLPVPTRDWNPPGIYLARSHIEALSRYSITMAAAEAEPDVTSSTESAESAESDFVFSAPPPRRSSVPSTASWLCSTSTIPLSVLNRLVRQLTQASVHVRRIEEMPSDDCVHPTYTLTLSDGSPPLLLILPPRTYTKLLRIEARSLEMQVHLYQLVAACTAFPGPRLLAYDLTAKRLRSTPFVLTACGPGRRRRSAVDKEISHCRGGRRRPTPDGSAASWTSLVQALDPIVCHYFGPLPWASTRRPATRSWRLAFGIMLEDVLRDGEDMFVTLPYEDARAVFARHAHTLDEIQEARLTLLPASDFLIQEGEGEEEEGGPSEDRPDDEAARGGPGQEAEPRDLAQLLGGGVKAIWGDPDLASATLLRSADVKARRESVGGDKDDGPTDAKAAAQERRRMRRALYAIFRSLLCIVEETYRPRIDRREMDARKSLTSILRELC